jgi:hypothetical protein
MTMRSPEPKMERRYDLRAPIERRVEIHLIDCACAACEPYVPSVPGRLTAVDMGRLAVGGTIVGSAIAFAIDPAGAAAALYATIGL